MQLDDYYTIGEFCSVAGFSRQWLYYLWSRNQGPEKFTRRIGNENRVLIPTASADAFLASRFLHNVRQEQRTHQTAARRARTTENGVQNVQF